MRVRIFEKDGITKIIPPEHFLSNVAATGLSLFAREHAKEFALKNDCFVIFTNICAETFFCKMVFVIILAAMVIKFDVIQDSEF